MENRHNPKDLIIGVVVGGILGATTALLLAPKSGNELREDINDKVQEYTDKTQKLANQVTKKSHLVAKGISCQACDIADKAKDFIDTISSNIKSWKEGFTNGTKIEEVEHSSRIEDILDWATLGVSIWQKLSKRR